MHQSACSSLSTCSSLFWQLLHESGVPLNTSAERDIAKDMKEELCYVADDYMRELYRVNDCDVTLQKHYTLPDGHMVSVGSERFRSVCVRASRHIAQLLL